MPKPPTAERGRRRRTAPPPPPPTRRHWRERFAPVRAEGSPGDADFAEATESGRHWRALVTPLLCVLALGVSTYLTIAHFQPASLSCPLGGTHGVVDCQKVTTSPESYILGIPVAILGLAFYVPMLALCLPAAWRSAHRYVAPARLTAAITGVGMVCYLVYAELYEIHAICIWCTAVHVLTFLLFVVIVTGWDQARAPYLLAEDAQDAAFP